MKTLRTVSAFIVTVAMIAVMAIGAFAVGNYDWNLLNIDYSSEAQRFSRAHPMPSRTASCASTATARTRITTLTFLK